MRLKNNILLLDTETTGDFGQPLVHDLGYVIIDKDFNILKKTRRLVKQARDCKWALNYSEFYRSKAQLYDDCINNGEVQVSSWKNIIDDFKQDIKKYKVGCIAAYNLAFDYRALNFTNHFLNNEDDFFEKLLDNKKWLCIWNLACETILNEDDYRSWCKSHKKVSDCGNYLTNAETTYQYLFNEDDFQEEHTALKDVLIETEILKKIATTCKGKAQYGLQYQCWKKIQDKRDD